MSDNSSDHNAGASAIAPKPRRRRVRKFDPIFDCSTDLLFEPLFQTAKGKRKRKVSTAEIMLLRLYKAAMEGKPHGIRGMIRIMRKNQKVREAEQEFHESFPPEGYHDPQNADAALLILGLATVDRSELDVLQRMDKTRPRRWGLVIEPELVAAALARSDAPLLNHDQSRAIGRHTRDARIAPVEEAELEGALLYDAAVLPRDPRETRFKPGQSGNRKGRPPRIRLELPFEGLLDEVIVVPVEGAMREMTRLDALLYQLMKRAIQHDDRVEQLLIDLIIEEQGRRFKHRPGQTYKIPESRI